MVIIYITFSIYFNVKNKSGYWEKIPAFEGETVLDALLRMNVENIQFNVCLGGDSIYQPH